MPWKNPRPSADTQAFRMRKCAPPAPQRFLNLDGRGGAAPNLFLGLCRDRFALGSPRENTPDMQLTIILICV